MLKYSAEVTWMEQEELEELQEGAEPYVSWSWWTPIGERVPEHAMCSIIIQWCNPRSYRIRKFLYPFSTGKQWLESKTNATIEIVKLCKERKIRKLGIGMSGRTQQLLVLLRTCEPCPCKRT